MNKIAKFEKVSFEQFLKDYHDTFLSDHLKAEQIVYVKELYDAITLPKRSTGCSAGHDFVSPIDFELHPKECIKIPTGIRATMEPDWVLLLFVRSSIGFKYQTMLVNTVPVIDADYALADNEGHIFIKLRNDGEKVLSVKAGDRLVQGVFLPYGITVDDEADGERFGGMGSTGK